MNAGSAGTSPSRPCKRNISSTTARKAPRRAQEAAQVCGHLLRHGGLSSICPTPPDARYRKGSSGWRQSVVMTECRMRAMRRGSASATCPSASSTMVATSPSDR